MSKLDRPTKSEAADLVRQRVSSIRADCEHMLADAAAVKFDRVVNWPSYALRFAAEIQEFNSYGYTAEVLGPLIVEAVESDASKNWASDYAGTYTAFKSAVTALCGFVMANIGLFAPSYDASGLLKFSTAPQEVIDELITKLDTVLANIPGA